MAIITPQTDVYLLKMPLEVDDMNQLTFSNLAAQQTYFNGLTKLHIGDDFTYQRKDGIMRVPYLIDDLYGYNYCMYKNKGHSNKWFFAFITGMEYLNDSVTGISLKTDVWQTWQFDLTYKPTFVEREHANVDIIGSNTVPEDLDTGELIISKAINYWDTFDDQYHDGDYPRIVELMAVTCMPDGSTPESHDYGYTGRMNGLCQGLFFMIFTSAQEVKNAVHDYDRNGRGDAVYSITECYRYLFDETIFEEDPKVYVDLRGSFYFYVPNESEGGITNCAMGNPVTVAYPNTLVGGKYVPTFDGYQCKNMKMLTYPYAYIRATNHAGGEAIYKWEDFAIGTTIISDSPNVYFQMYGSISVSPNYKVCPCNYKRLLGNSLSAKEPNYDWGLTGQKMPPCSWISDYFTNWLTQNAVNFVTGGISDSVSGGVQGWAGMSLARTPLMANITAATTSVDLAAKTASNMANIYAHSKIPDQIKGDANAGDLNYSLGYTGVSFYSMTVRNDYAQRIDKYFTCFGYRTNQVKVPNITGRRNWNYVKTSKCYIEASIPQEDLEEIKSMFDKGITLWHNPSTFMDYSQQNDIIV